MPDGPNIAPPIRDELEKVVVRLLEIATRCGDYAIERELMQLGDDLAGIIDERVERPRWLTHAGC